MKMTYVMMALIQILYVALYSIRSVFMIKGMKYLASLISTMEVFVYIMGLSIVLTHMDSAAGIVIYCSSFGVGILIGVFIEQKLALGYIALQVISENNREEMAIELRKNGYGVTTWIGEGAAGIRAVLFIVAKRKYASHLKKTIQRIDSNAFMITFEPSHFVGGFFWKKSQPFSD
jgi:uncharacterized protein YebE (UPF0316 family)